jgi:hypothetical protein
MTAQSGAEWMGSRKVAVHTPEVNYVHYRIGNADRTGICDNH